MPPRTPALLLTRLRSVPRRLSSGAQYAGRGGAGNAFKADEVADELSRKSSNENAIDDGSSGHKAKHWLFGKKA